MPIFKLKLGAKTEIDLRSVIFFESLSDQDYTRLAEHWQAAGQGGAQPSDFKTRIVFVNREPTLTRTPLDDIVLRAPAMIEVQPGRLVPLAAIRLVKPVDDQQRMQMAAAYPDQAAAIAGKQTRFEYALPDADGDPVVKHYPITIKDMRQARVNLVNIGDDRHVFASNITGVDRLSEEALSRLREAYTLAGNHGTQIQTIHGPLIGTVPAHAIRQRAGLKAPAVDVPPPTLTNSG
jgi:hypothetical protein